MDLNWHYYWRMDHDLNKTLPVCLSCLHMRVNVKKGTGNCSKTGFWYVFNGKNLEFCLFISCLGWTPSKEYQEWTHNLLIKHCLGYREMILLTQDPPKIVLPNQWSVVI